MTVLVDTNVLVYAVGVKTDQARQESALAALQQAHVDGALSVQVLSEFSSVLVRNGRPIETVRRYVQSLVSGWVVLEPTADTVVHALAGVRDYQLNFWDAMIWATAVDNHIATILTEDGPTGASLGGVTFVSPF